MERKIEMQHPSHEHPLIWGYIEDASLFIRCHICNDNIEELSYFVCLQCNYSYHYLCVLPFLQQIEHPSHPNHPLILQINNSEGIPYCEICDHSLDIYSPYYSCDRCNFELDIYCALKFPTVNWESRRPGDDQRLCHKQPMELIFIKHGEDDDDDVKYCYICELPLLSQSYHCKICNHFFHRSCAELSPVITHPFHQSHSLNLSPGCGERCISCRKQCSNFIFRCETGHCDIYICVGCRSVLKPTIMCQGHSHPLFLASAFIAPRHLRYYCETPFTCYERFVNSSELRGTENYIFRCCICDFKLHFFCGPLPCVIKHNCHTHPLTLFDSVVEDDFGEYYCDACEKERDPRICVYYCAKCKYIAHLDCVLDEVLRVLKGDCRDVKLRMVGQRKMVIETDYKILRLVENEINIDSTGVAPPEKEVEATTTAAANQTLTTFSDLIISVAKQFGLITTDQNDNQGVRIIEQLQAEKEAGPLEEEDDVEDSLEEEEERNRIVRNNIENKNPLVLVHSLLTGTENQFVRFFEDDHKQFEKGLKWISHDPEMSYRSFIRKLKNLSYDKYTKWIIVTPSEREMKIVNVGGYMITWNLAYVMEDLLAKHGDISGNKISSPELKSLIFFFLCRILHTMSRTMVVDVTENLLEDWYSCLNFVKSNGFKVGFVMSRLKRVVRVAFGAGANSVKKEEKTNLEEVIGNLEAKLNKYKKHLEEHERAWDFKRNNLMDRCFNELVQLKWKKVADDLF